MKEKDEYYKLAVGVLVQAIKDYVMVPRKRKHPKGDGYPRVWDDNFHPDIKKEAEKFLFSPALEIFLDLAEININPSALRARLKKGTIDMSALNFFDPTTLSFATPGRHKSYEV